jgi:NADPH2:quinone reductase
MSTTMRAVGAVGGLAISEPGAMRDIDAPVPQLRPRDVLVAVDAVSVNPVDTKVRGRMSAGEDPRILGFDAAGTVQAVGPEVTTLSPGDEVWYAGVNNRPGSDAELQAVDERIVSRRPETLSAREAAALPLTAITAWESLFDHLKLEPDTTGTLLVLAGAGGVGSILIQLARQLTPDLHVIATASRSQSRAWVTELGAHAVVDHHDLVAQTREVAPAGIDYIFSPASKGNEAAFAKLLVPFGQIVAIDDPGEVDIMAFKPKSISWHWEFMFARARFETADMARQGQILGDVAALVDGGTIRTTVTETIEDFSAAGIRRAHELVESGAMVGKVVVTR